MKKLIALLLIMLLVTPLTALAAPADLSFMDGGAYTSSVTGAGDTLIIESTLTPAERAFTHDQGSTYCWSTTQFDVICTDYEADDACAALRLWITVASDNELLGVKSVTFTLGEQIYTFSAVASADRVSQVGSSFMQELLITVGGENQAFLLALTDHFDGSDACTLTLHAQKDITAELGDGFASDFRLMNEAFSALNGMDAISRVAGTPMTRGSADQTSQTGYYVVVTAATAKVRTSASLSGTLLMTARKGNSFRLIRESGDWYVIDVHGQTGYIHKGVTELR